MDLCNVPGMLKGYLDGFTDAQLWGDDSQLVDVRFRWMTPAQGAAWLEHAGEEDLGLGLLIFEISVEDSDGEDDGK
jgi:hypothetical protein